MSLTIIIMPKTGMEGIFADFQKANECKLLIGELENRLKANPGDNGARLDLFNLETLYATLTANLSKIF